MISIQLIVVIVLLQLLSIKCFIHSSSSSSSIASSSSLTRRRHDINMNNNENNNRNDNNYKGNNNNRSRPNSGSSSSSSGSNDRDKEWQSGFIFTKNNSRPPGGKRRNDPWWMREEEKDNPRMLPFYRPWWLQKDINTIDDMKVNQLKDEAKLRGLDASGLKADLIQRLKESYDKFNLTDDCFTEPIYKKSDPKALPPCYPDIYENENEIKRLKLSDTSIAPPSS